jgi:hypothetical protein
MSKGPRPLPYCSLTPTVKRTLCRAIAPPAGLNLLPDEHATEHAWRGLATKEVWKATPPRVSNCSAAGARIAVSLRREEVDPTRFPQMHAGLPARWIKMLHDGAWLQVRNVVPPPLALALASCVLIEVSVGFGIWLALGRDSGEPVSALSRARATLGPRPMPTVVPVARTTLDLESAYPTLVPRRTVAPTAPPPVTDEASAALLSLTSPTPTPSVTTALADTSSPDQVAAARQPDQASEASVDAIAALDAAESGAPSTDAGSMLADDLPAPSPTATEVPASQPPAVAEEPLVQAAPPRVTPALQRTNSQPLRTASSSRAALNAAPVVVRSAPPPAAPPTPTKAPFVAPVQR